MSDDLVRRLKAIEVQPIDQFGRWLTNIHAEAAAEIERQATELAAFRTFLTERGCGGVGDANGMHDLAQHHEELIADNERQAARVARLEAALDELCRLQSHYAWLLNTNDGGGRRMFRTGEEWITRLDELRPAAALADAPEEGRDDNERAERIAYCIARGIDPFEIVADGGCEAWMAVTEHNLRAASAALADAPGEGT